MVRIGLLSAAHVHTKGFLKNIADNDDRNVTVIYDDVADRGQRYAADSGAEYSGDLEATLAREDVDGFKIGRASCRERV